MKKYILIEKYGLEGYSSLLQSSIALLDNLGFDSAVLPASRIGDNFAYAADQEARVYAAMKLLSSLGENEILLALDDSQYEIIKEGYAKYVSDSVLKKHIDARLGITTEITLDSCKHILDLLLENTAVEAIRQKAQKSFENFSAYLHIGNKTYMNLERKNKIEQFFQILDLQFHTDAVSFYNTGIESVGINNSLALKLSASILESSIDSGSDFTTSFDAGNFAMQETYREHTQKALNRDTLNQPFLFPQQLALIALGVRDKKSLALKEHKNKITFLD